MKSNPNNNLADLIVAYLEQLGVEYVFGIPGGHIMPLYEALDRSEKRGGPRAIFSRHENGAAYMADGYARESGKLGVCCVTTGPGITNIVSGIASAYFDYTPLLLISGQTSLIEFGAGSFQESSPDVLDTTAILKPCTRYSSIITHPNQFARKITAALHHAFYAPGGPVHLSIPIDIHRTPAPVDLNTHFRYPQAELVDYVAFERLWTEISAVLKRGKKIIILVGHCAAPARNAIQRFAELTNTNLITTHRGKSWVDHYHPLVRGVFGYAGHATARQALLDPEVELILATGTGLGQWSTSNWDPILLNDRLIHIHPDSAAFSRSPMARLQVLGMIQPIFEELNRRINSLAPELSLTQFTDAPPQITRRGAPAQIKVQNPDEYLSSIAPLHPQRLMYELMQRLPPEARITIDNSNWLPWSIHHLFTADHTSYRASVEFGAMGRGIGAAIGIAMANRGIPVVSLTGDGCFAMSGQEIAVAVAERLPVIFIIINDCSFGMVRHRHRQISPNPLPLHLPYVDFALIAQAVGAEGFTIHQPSDLDQIDFAALCNKSGPTLLNVLIDPDVMPAMGMF